MQGKTKKRSRAAGILNIAATVLLILSLVLFVTVGNFGITDGSASSSENDEEAAKQALGFVISLIFFLPIILVMLIPLGIINAIAGLAMGIRCLRRAPGLGRVIFSLILKIVTVPVFSFAILLLFALADTPGAYASAFFPAVFSFYLILLITAHVFEWGAHRAAKAEGPVNEAALAKQGSKNARAYETWDI